MMKNKNEYSEHFIRFALNGEEMDFDSFKTQEEFDNYELELKDFLNKSDEEINEIVKGLREKGY